MSYYKVKSVNLRNPEEIFVTAACNNVRPIHYSREKYKGSIENFFQDLLSGNLQINHGNKQKVHDAYLQAKLYLRDKKVDTYELYEKDYKGDPHYEKAFEIFKQVLKEKKNKRKYYIRIKGRNFYGWTKYGYSYSYYEQKRSFTDLLKAQLSYSEKVSYKEA